LIISDDGESSYLSCLFAFELVIVDGVCISFGIFCGVLNRLACIEESCCLASLLDLDALAALLDELMEDDGRMLDPFVFELVAFVDVARLEASVKRISGENIFSNLYGFSVKIDKIENIDRENFYTRIKKSKKRLREKKSNSKTNSIRYNVK
jgi:hypothetical protein